jgi:hypothetical protein
MSFLPLDKRRNEVARDAVVTVDVVLTFDARHLIEINDSLSGG